MKNQSNLRERPVASGYFRVGRNYKQVNIALDQDTFVEIQVMAEKEKCSFAEAVRRLIEWGLGA